MRIRLWLVVLVALGCGVGLGGVFVGRATAQGPAYRQWEYNCAAQIEKPWRPEDLERMNALGARGWELVLQMNQGNRDVYCFKRPLR